MMTSATHFAGFSDELEKIALSNTAKYSLIASPLGAVAGAAYAAIKYREAPKKQRDAEIRSAAIKGAVAGAVQGLLLGRSTDAQVAQHEAIKTMANALQETRSTLREQQASMQGLGDFAKALKAAAGQVKRAEDQIEGQLVLNLDPKILRQIQRAQKKQKPPAQAALEKTAIDLALAKNLLKLVFTMGFMKAVYDHAASSDE